MLTSALCCTSVPLLPPATKLGQGNIFRSVCQEFCSHLEAVHAGRYGQQADGMHPTGMHTCYLNRNHIKNCARMGTAIVEKIAGVNAPIHYNTSHNYSNRSHNSSHLINRRYECTIMHITVRITEAFGLPKPKLFSNYKVMLFLCHLRVN